MAELTLDVARKILDAALAKAVEKELKPLVVTVLDARGDVFVAAEPSDCADRAGNEDEAIGVPGRTGVRAPTRD